jgi:hypothetical protein
VEKWRNSWVPFHSIPRCPRLFPPPHASDIFPHPAAQPSLETACDSSRPSQQSCTHEPEAKSAPAGKEKEGGKMSWQSYVDDHLMCDIDGQQLTSAAIVGLDGSVWAQSEKFPQVSSFSLVYHCSSLPCSYELLRPASDPRVVRSVCASICSPHGRIGKVWGSGSWLPSRDADPVPCCRVRFIWVFVMNRIVSLRVMMCWCPICISYSRVTGLSCCRVGHSIRFGLVLVYANFRSRNGQTARSKH